MYLTSTVLIIASIYASVSSQHNEITSVQPKEVGIAYLIPLFQPIHQEDNEILSNEEIQENDRKYNNMPLYALLFPVAPSRVQNFGNTNDPIRLKGEMVSGRQKRSPQYINISGGANNVNNVGSTNTVNRRTSSRATSINLSRRRNRPKKRGGARRQGK